LQSKQTHHASSNSTNRFADRKTLGCLSQERVGTQGSSNTRGNQSFGTYSGIFPQTNILTSSGHSNYQTRAQSSNSNYGTGSKSLDLKSRRLNKFEKLKAMYYEV